MCFSADVVSLFTNVPVEEATDILVEDAYKQPDKPPVNKNTFKELILLATKNITFLAPDNTEWYQRDGVAMGSQLGPALANVWMAKKIDPKVREILQNGKYHRYVDDTLASTKEDHIQDIHTKMNEIHEKVEITIERPDENRELAFLDIKIKMNEDVSSTTSLYRKTSATDVVMNYLADAPWQHKKAAATAMIQRAISIPSNEEERQRAMTKVKEMLHMNQWPDKVIKTLVRNIQTRNQQQTSKTIRNNLPTLTLPWVDSRTEEVLKKVKCIAEKKGMQIETAIRTDKIRNVCNNKARIKNGLLSNVVYELTCQTCNGFYVGQTSRHLMQRFKEHQRGNTLPTHTCTTGVKEEGLRILYRGRGTYEIRIAEAIYINDRKPTLNGKEERTYNLNLKLL